MIQICFTLVDTHIYCCPCRDVGSKWIRLANDADFEQEPSETENKHMWDSALFNLVYGSNPTSGLKWSGPAVGHVQPTTVGNLLQYIHVMSLSVIMKLTYKLTWDQTNPDSTCRIIFRSQSGSQSALNVARLKCKWSAALMDHKGFNTLTSWFIRAVHAIELFIPTVTQEKRQFWSLIRHQSEKIQR